MKKSIISIFVLLLTFSSLIAQNGCEKKRYVFFQLSEEEVFDSGISALKDKDSVNALCLFYYSTLVAEKNKNNFLIQKSAINFFEIFYKSKEINQSNRYREIYEIYFDNIAENGIVDTDINLNLRYIKTRDFPYRDYWTKPSSQIPDSFKIEIILHQDFQIYQKFFGTKELISKEKYIKETFDLIKSIERLLLDLEKKKIFS